MAKITSPVFSSIRGSISGATYLAGPGNPIIGRQRVLPVDPMTENQVTVRKSLMAASEAWEAMGDIKRQAWIDYAVGIGWTKGARLLFTKNYSFMDYVWNRGVEPDAPITEAPTSFVAPQITVQPTAYTGGVGTFGVAVEVTNLTNLTIRVASWISVQLPQSRYFWKGPFDSQTIDANDVDPADTVEIDFPVAGGIANNIVFCRLRPYVRVAGGAPYDLIGEDSIHRLHVAATTP